MTVPEALSACPHCGRANEFRSHTAGLAKPPDDGDVAICWGCVGVSVFVDGPLGKSQRKPTEAELAEILADQDVRRALAACAESAAPSQALALLRGES